MKITKVNYLNILWLFLSFGLIVLSKFEELSMYILYGIIPFCFISVVLSELKIYLSNKLLLQFIYFFIWCSVSLIYSADKGVTANYLSILVGNIVLWYTTYRIVMRSNDLRVIVFIFFLCFLYHAVSAFLHPVEYTVSFMTERSTGLFTNANVLGFAMWYGLITVIFLSIIIKDKFIKILLWSCIPLFLYVLFLSGSRKNVLAVIIYLFVIVYYFAKTRHRLIIIFTGILIFVILKFVDFSFLESLPIGARMNIESLASGTKNRLELINDGFAMFKESPIIGVGLGSFTFYSSSGLYAHNEYVEILATTGLVGILLYLPIYLMFFTQNRFLLNHQETFVLGVMSQAFLIGFMSLGMGRPTFLDPDAMLVLALFHSIALKKLQEIESVSVPLSVSG